MLSSPSRQSTSPSPRLSLLRNSRSHRCRCGASAPRVFASDVFSAKLFRIGISAKHTHNPCRIRTSKTRHLNSFGIRTYEKRGRGAEGLIADQKSDEAFLSRTTIGSEGPLSCARLQVLALPEGTPIRASKGVSVLNDYLEHSISSLCGSRALFCPTFKPLTFKHFNGVPPNSPRNRAQERIMTRRSHEK
jgi:hypothetical protein